MALLFQKEKNMDTVLKRGSWRGEVNSKSDFANCCYKSNVTPANEFIDQKLV